MDTNGSPVALPHRNSENQPTETNNSTDKSHVTPNNPTSRDSSPEGSRPPLPPRPRKPSREELAPNSDAGPTLYYSSSTHNLQSRPTTALSLANVNTQALDDTNRDISTSLAKDGNLGNSLRPQSSSLRLGSARGSDTGDSASIKSYIPGGETPIEAGSVFGDFPGTVDGQRSRDSRAGHGDGHDIFGLMNLEEDDLELAGFDAEFESVGEAKEDDSSDAIIENWRKKKKHFFIVSSAGKPIYTRHGDDGLISPFTGIIQTIISFYQESENSLKCFSAGKTKITILSQGSLYLVAISSLLESESQLRNQLEALYMQILSTLTLPALNNIFTLRPGSDLRRPLQGTESLLSSLADSFTRGSPSTLLSALECLRIRKSHRQVINNTLLRRRVDPLLYGLVVAGGRLVSVIRPKKHSLHPGDLQLIFNMIFEADGVKTGGGENWIPICLPAFNNKGYLYMYVSFLDIHTRSRNSQSDVEMSKDDVVAVILISTDKESFFTLRDMRDSIVKQMDKDGSINIIRTALEKGRPSPTDIVPGTVLRHFLYKSKANVQFTMSSFSPDFVTIIGRRRLFSAYHSLHASVHAKHAHVKVQYCVSGSMNSLAWVTPTFELYCVASPNSNRNALSQSATKIAQWAQKEEERVFIIGGAVF